MQATGWSVTGQRVVYMALPAGSLDADRLGPVGRWRVYRNLLERLGAEARIVPSGADVIGDSGTVYREVFTRDRAFLIGDIAFLPDVGGAALEHHGGIDVGSTGRGIQAIDCAFRTRLQQDGFRIVTTAGHFFEGGNFIYDRGSNTLFIGMPRGFDIAPGELIARTATSCRPDISSGTRRSRPSFSVKGSTWNSCRCGAARSTISIRP